MRSATRSPVTTRPASRSSRSQTRRSHRGRRSGMPDPSTSAVHAGLEISRRRERFLGRGRIGEPGGFGAVALVAVARQQRAVVVQRRSMQSLMTPPERRSIEPIGPDRSQVDRLVHPHRLEQRRARRRRRRDPVHRCAAQIGHPRSGRLGARDATSGVGARAAQRSIHPRPVGSRAAGTMVTQRRHHVARSEGDRRPQPGCGRDAAAHDATRPRTLSA